IDAEDTSQTIEESLVVGKESRRRKKVKPKGKKVAMAEETIEGPGAAYQGSKEKTVMPQSSKAQKETDLALMKAEQASQGTGGEPGAVLELQNENAQLKAESTTLKKLLEDLTQQMLHDQRAAN
ncbi:hypothetical protein HAX54_010006, partial [Datura stramonium]|nr:hypothetical protein [Datura stramonium]